ncbi:MAG TPA: hypothetical protein V6D17_21430 [Candidatus Obscuribacterales bacterium]
MAPHYESELEQIRDIAKLYQAAERRADYEALQRFVELATTPTSEENERSAKREAELASQKNTAAPAQETQAAPALETEAPASQGTEAPASQGTEAPTSQVTEAAASQETQAAPALETEAPALQVTEAAAFQEAQATAAPGAESTAARNTEEQARAKKKLIPGLLITTYIFILGLMLLPSWPARDALIKPFQPFWGAFGLWQAWNLFSPEIRTENLHIVATITFKDGSIIVWEFPRQERRTGIDQMRAERFRKWVNDRVRKNTYGIVLPDAARFIARLHRNKENPPAGITIMIHSAPIPPPGVAPQAPLPTHYQHKTIYTYKVEAEDLQ